MNSPIHKYGVVLTLATVSDAEFIITLRTGNNTKFISSTSSSIQAQKDWLNRYKERESNGEEYYFIVSDLLGNRWGTTRIYDIRDNSFETGSWVFLPRTPSGIAIKGDIVGREFAFDLLESDKCTFEVRKENKSVIKYHLGYSPTVVAEDELNIYFELSREKFENHVLKLLKLLL